MRASAPAHVPARGHQAQLASLAKDEPQRRGQQDSQGEVRKLDNWKIDVDWTYERFDYCAVGRLKVKTEPCPGRLTTLMVPPCNSTIAFAIGKPMPVPWTRDRCPFPR